MERKGVEFINMQTTYSNKEEIGRIIVGENLPIWGLWVEKDKRKKMVIKVPLEFISKLSEEDGEQELSQQLSFSEGK